MIDGIELIDTTVNVNKRTDEVVMGCCGAIIITPDLAGGDYTMDMWEIIDSH